MTPDRPISALFAERRPLRSLEFFPPKDDAGVEALRQAAVLEVEMMLGFSSTSSDLTRAVREYVQAPPAAAEGGSGGGRGPSMPRPLERLASRLGARH